MAKQFRETYGMVEQADLLQTGFLISRPSDPLEGLFEDRQTDHLVAEWYTIASEYQIPQMAQFHAFDTIAQKSERAPIDEHNVEKGLIKVKRNTSELLRQLIGKGVNIEGQLYDYVMDDAASLADQVVTRAKVARAELLATGQITIKENNLDLTVDYGVPNAHKGLDFDLGPAADDDILTQIQAIVDLAAASGVTLTGMVCANSVLSKLRNNEAVKVAINGTAGAGALVRRGAVAEFMNEEFGIGQIIVDDLTYALPYTTRSNNRPAVTSKRYYPENRVTFFGTANGMGLGAGLWGVPPEVEIARFGANVGGSTISPYVWITQWAENDPAVVWTKASALYMPVLFSPQSLFIANVTETTE